MSQVNDRASVSISDNQLRLDIAVELLQQLQQVESLKSSGPTVVATLKDLYKWLTIQTDFEFAAEVKYLIVEFNKLLSTEQIDHSALEDFLEALQNLRQRLPSESQVPAFKKL
jgi:hypothetical protein